jgi:hypothetical protein
MARNLLEAVMKRYVILAVLVVTFAVSGCAHLSGRCQLEPPVLAHNVYFTLNDHSEAARAKLIADCYKYLSGEPGIVAFAAGEIVESHTRDVNVRDWDVSLHIVFKDKKYHDLYQNAPDHQKFIAENSETWKTVRVFDTFIR